MCVFSEIDFWSSLYVFSLGNRLLNPTKPLWAWTDKIIPQPHAQPQPQPKINLQIRQVKIKMITNGQDFSSWKLQTKITTQLKCIRAEKSNRWYGKCWPWQCQTHEIRQCLYWSRNKTAMQKSLEDNQAPGLFTCESVATQNPNPSKFVIKCEELDTMEEDEIKKELQPQGILAVKRISIRYSLYVLTIKGQNIPPKNQYWIPKKRNTTIHSQPSKMFSMPEIWTYKEFV